MRIEKVKLNEGNEQFVDKETFINHLYNIANDVWLFSMRIKVGSNWGSNMTTDDSISNIEVTDKTIAVTGKNTNNNLFIQVHNNLQYAIDYTTNSATIYDNNNVCYVFALV